MEPPAVWKRSSKTQGIVISDGPVSKRNPLSAQKFILPPKLSPCSQTVTRQLSAARRKAIANPPSPPPMMTACFISKIEDRGSRIEDRGSKIENRPVRMALSSIFYPRSSILMISPAFPVDAPAALASQPRGDADGEQERFGQRVQQDGQPGMSEA